MVEHESWKKSSKKFSAKFQKGKKVLYGEISVRPNLCTARLPTAKTSSLQNLFTAKFPYAEISQGKIFQAKIPTAKFHVTTVPRL